MAKYHVNPKTGNPNVCSAKISCPFGGPEAHYTTAEAARAAFEEKRDTFKPLTPAETLKLLRKKLVIPDNVDYDYIEYGLKYIEEWKQPWTPAEEENFQRLTELAKVLGRKPFKETDLKEAKELYETFTPPATAKLQSSNNNELWRARDRSIDQLAKNLIFRKEMESLTHEPAEAIVNDSIVGLEQAQELALHRENYFDLKYTTKAQYGDVEPYLQESIARVVRGDKPVEELNDNRPLNLLPVSERLFNKLHPESAAYDQQLYLATVFPVRELKDEMERLKLASITVSPLNNGREKGNVYSVLQPDGSVRAFAVYEHRNTDSIIINGKENWDGKELPYATDSKSGFYAEIAVGENKRAAQTLAYFISKAQKGELESDEELVKKAPKLDWNSILSKSLPGFSEWLEKQGVERKDPKNETEEDILTRLDF